MSAQTPPPAEDPGLAAAPPASAAFRTAGRGTLLFGLLGLAVFGRTLVMGQLAAGWTPTPATVDHEAPRLVYGYDWEGTRYTSPLVRWDTTGDATVYSEGQSITALVNPSNPTQAVLETGVGWGTWVQTGVGIGFLIAGFGFLGWARQEANRESGGEV